MLARRYLTSAKNLPAIMAKVTEGTAPKKFTITHLKSLGFKSSSDRGVLAILKELGFLSDDGTPMRRYHDYRDKSRSKAVMAQALRESYEGIFHINERPTESDRASIIGKFKSDHNVSDSVAKKQAMTFFALLELADLDSEGPVSGTEDSTQTKHEQKVVNDLAENEKMGVDRPPANLSLRYNLEIHLPSTKDIEVYNAIFQSLKVHLLDD